MSTNNLPAGFSITSIGGKRCTAVPRAQSSAAAAVSTSTPEVVATTQEETPAQETPAPAASSAQLTVNVPDIVAPAPVASTTSIAPVASTPEITSTPVPSTTAIEDPTTEALLLSSTSASAQPASKVTTPTSSSSTILADAQSEVSATPMAVGISNDTGTLISTTFSTDTTPTTTPTPPAESSAAAAISPSPKPSMDPIVGGVLGSIAAVALIGVIFWFCRRRRKNKRDSFLTPLSTGTRNQFYEIDSGSVGPTKRSKRWRAEAGYRIQEATEGFKAGLIGLGASLKSKVVGDRSDTPSVNLNRGNSQFFDGPVPQHSRNNSSILPAHTGQSSVKDRFADWWEAFTEKWRLRRLPNEAADPFATARSMTEKQAINNTPPDFSKLLTMDDREMQLQADRRRSSLSGPLPAPTLPQLSSLDFHTNDPFADPSPQKQSWKPATSINPFADPIPQPEPTASKSQTYITSVRRSRGQSVDNAVTANSQNANINSLYRQPSAASRYPSSIAMSRDSYRDTVYSTFSANARKGKGRSDPFDLERPELWRPKQVPTSSSLYPNSNLNGTTTNITAESRFSKDAGHTRKGSVTRARESAGQYLSPLRTGGAQPPSTHQNSTQRMQSGGTYSSHYNSGVSSLGGWGDPGPDLGPSGNSSLRGNASSNGGSVDLGQKWDNKRNADNVSPLSVESKASSKGEVGKAM